MINANTDFIKFLHDDKKVFILYKVLEIYFENDYHKYISFWDFSAKLNNAIDEKGLKDFNSFDDLKNLLI